LPFPDNVALLCEGPCLRFHDEQGDQPPNAAA